MRRALSRLKARDRAALISAVVVGLIAHAVAFVNFLPTHDSMYNFFDDGKWQVMGRYLMKYADMLSTRYDVPWLTGLWSLVFLALGSLVVVRLLDIRSNTGAALTAGLIVSFPSVTTTFAYMFMADGYMLSLVFAALSARMTKKWRLGFLPGAVCLAACMAIYQAGVSFAALLCVFSLLLTLLDGEKRDGEVWLSLGRFALMGVLGAALYYGALKAILAATNMSLTDYQGISSLGGGGGAAFIDKFWAIFMEFRFCIQKYIAAADYMPFRVLVVLALAMAGALYIWLFIAKKAWRRPVRIVIALALLIALPAITGAVFLITTGAYYHMIMRMSWCVFFIALVKLWEMFSELPGMPKARRVICAAAPAVCALLILGWCLIANLGYLNMHQKYERSYSLALRLVDRIEQTEGYSQKAPVIFVGAPDEAEYPEIGFLEDELQFMVGMRGDTIYNEEYHYRAFTYYYMGVSFEPLNDPLYREQIIASEEFAEMGCFPASDSVRMIGGVMVVKMSDEPA